MIASRSPSSVILAPVVVLISCISDSEASDGARLVGMNLNEVLCAGHGEHRLDTLLDVRELELPSGAADLTVQVHQAADRRAVDICDGREVDQDVSLAASHKGGDGGGKVPEDRVHQPRLAHADNRNA